MLGCANQPLVDTWWGFSISMSNHPECVLQHVHPLWTHALWWQYQHSIIHTKCLKTPCAFTAPHSCIQFTLSNDFNKSGLPTHTRTQTAKSLSITTFAGARHFPNQYTVAKTVLLFRLHRFQHTVIARQNYNKKTCAANEWWQLVLKSVGNFACCDFANITNQVICQARGIR